MNMEPRFISLGGDCQPGHHSRRIMSYQDIPFVFDWLETPIAAITKLIETDFQDFFLVQNLEWQDHGDFWSVRDSANGITSNHHFKTGAPEPLEQVPQTFRLFGRRFMNVLRSDAPVIYLRRWIKLDGDAREDAARDLYARIRAIKPDCVFMYLQPHEPRAPLIDGHFISVYNPITEAGAHWAGYTAIYDRNFRRAARLLDGPAALLTGT